MKVLVVGSGGREHAICWAIKKSPKVTDLYCAPGNGGIREIAHCVDVKATDIPGMVTWAKEHCIDFVMVAPDDPLAMGMVDAMEAAGIRAFGPRANAAIVEGSKAFSKELMKKYGIPTATYEIFTDKDAALAYVEAQGAPIVVKCDGLALGKGVIVAQTLEEARAAVISMMENRAFGEAGAKEKALAEAGLSESDISHLSVKFDHEHGRAEYEVEFYSGRTEYNYEIDAATGEIISSEIDHD